MRLNLEKYAIGEYNYMAYDPDTSQSTREVIRFKTLDEMLDWAEANFEFKDEHMVSMEFNGISRIEK